MVDRDSGFECGTGQVLTKAGRKELAEHSSSPNDQQQRCSYPCCMSDKATEADPDDGHKTNDQGSEDQGLGQVGRSEGHLAVLASEDPLTDFATDHGSRQRHRERQRRGDRSFGSPGPGVG